MAKGDRETTKFPTMGTEASRVAANAAQSPNLKYVPKGGAKGGSVPREKGAAGRRNYQTDDNRVFQTAERLGAKWAPQMTMSSPQAPEAAQNQRNTRVLQSAVGNRDFWYNRQYGQNML